MTSGVARFYDGKSKECGDCFEIKPVSAFSLTSEWSDVEISDDLPSSAYRSKCRKCKSQYCMNLANRKKLKLFPGIYWECDQCDHVSNKRFINCKKCGDEMPQEYK